MWKKLLEMIQDVYDLRRQVKGHDGRLNELSSSVQGLFKDSISLSERVLRVELELQHLKEQQAAERENFRLQLENLILRAQRGLPPGEKNEKDKGTEDQ
jgi:regulator of replication initiation timing